MEVDYRRNPQGNYMVFSHPETHGESPYFLQMILKNHIPGLLRTEQEIINGKIRLLYDITSMRSLADLMETEKIGQGRFCTMITDLINCTEGFREYLLDQNRILIAPEYIFLDQDTGKFSFCFDPFYEGDYQTALRDLFDRILEKIEYEDPDYVKLVYELHTLVQKDHFRINELSECMSRTTRNDPVNVRSMFEEAPEEVSPSRIQEPEFRAGRKNIERETEKAEEPPGFFEKIKDYMKGRKLKDVVSDIDNGVFLQKVNRPVGRPPVTIERKTNRPAEKPAVHADRKKKPGRKDDNFEMPPVRVRKERTEETSPEMPESLFHEDKIRYFRESVPLESLFYEDEERLFRESAPSLDFQGNQTVLLGKKENCSPCLVGLGRQKGSTIEIPFFPFRIGKLKGETECILDSPVISRMHAKISEEPSDPDGKCLLEDLNSTNGTFVNGVRLEPYNKVAIRPGDVIRFANQEYVLQHGSGKRSMNGMDLLK